MSTWPSPTKTWTAVVVTVLDLNTYISQAFNALHSTILSKSGNYTVGASDGHTVTVKMDASGGAHTVGTYTAVGNAGARITAKKTDTSGNGVAVDPNSTETVDTLASITLYAQNDYVTLESDDANWQIIAKRVTIRGRAFRNTSTQSISASTLTKVQLNGESFDVGGTFDSATNYRMTVPTGGDGDYIFSGTVYISSAGARSAVYLRKNGADYASAWLTPPASGDVAPNVTEVIPMVAGDYIELYAWEEGGTTTIANGTILTWLTWRLLH
jgi:hypothetical protein